MKPGIRRIANAENVRARIQTSMVINRLTDHIVGKIELSASQVRAAEILLNKTLPNLQATTISTDGEGMLAQILADIGTHNDGLPEPVDGRDIH